MTYRAGWLGLNKDGVLVAVFDYLFHIEKVTALLPLGPEPVFCTAEESYLALLFCLFWPDI